MSDPFGSVVANPVGSPNRHYGGVISDIRTIICFDCGRAHRVPDNVPMTNVEDYVEYSEKYGPPTDFTCIDNKSLRILRTHQSMCGRDITYFRGGSDTIVPYISDDKISISIRHQYVAYNSKTGVVSKFSRASRRLTYNKNTKRLYYMNRNAKHKMMIMDVTYRAHLMKNLIDGLKEHFDRIGLNPLMIASKGNESIYKFLSGIGSLLYVNEDPWWINTSDPTVEATACAPIALGGHIPAQAVVAGRHRIPDKWRDQAIARLAKKLGGKLTPESIGIEKRHQPGFMKSEAAHVAYAICDGWTSKGIDILMPSITLMPELIGCQDMIDGSEEEIANVLVVLTSPLIDRVRSINAKAKKLGERIHFSRLRSDNINALSKYFRFQTDGNYSEEVLTLLREYLKSKGINAELVSDANDLPPHAEPINEHDKRKRTISLRIIGGKRNVAIVVSNERGKGNDLSAMTDDGSTHEPISLNDPLSFESIERFIRNSQ